MKKANKHVLESLTRRIYCVRSFLTLFKPGLEYDIVPIQDVYGPTAVDPNIQALVVSKETLSGGAASGLISPTPLKLPILTESSRTVDKKRNELGFPALETFVIEVISAKDVALDGSDQKLLKKTKMSNTFIREWVANKRDGEPGPEAQSRPM